MNSVAMHICFLRRIIFNNNFYPNCADTFFSGKFFEFFFAQTSGKSTQTYPKTFSAQTHFSPPLGPRASKILKFSKKRHFTPKTPRPWKNFPGKKRQQNIYTCFSTDLLGTQSYENFNSE